VKVAPTPNRPAAPAQRAAPEPPPPPPPPKKNTEVRIAEAVQKQTGRLKQMVIGLAVFVVAGGAVAAWFAMQAAESQREQFAALLSANDSLARALEQRLTQTGVADAALRAARAESERLAKELRGLQQSGGDISAISAEMRSAQVRTSSISRMDYSAVTAANKAAVVFIAVQWDDAGPTSGTGFNILPSGLIVTNRHVVRNRSGARAERVAVVFDGQQGAWREATIEYVSETDELALLRLVRAGNYPAVTGVARDGGDVKLGDPVAILGFPLGTSTAGMTGNIDELRPEATLGVGTVSKTLADVLQLDAFAAQGSSGSPVFDARGLVVGVLYGAAAESGGRIIYAVPAARLATQLPTDAAGVLR
jgi:S1-C subfamily serine protease